MAQPQKRGQKSTTMRLLNTYTVQLEEFFDSNVPKYAILSHTWGRGEVTFQDFERGNYQGKDGYIKIQHACQQAREDELPYVWVDTCCIDKTSSAELSEAIN